jgi:phosphotriesterase-related protein
MSVVESVLGPIDSSKLGFTLMHEHIIGAAAGIPQAYPELLGKGYIDRIVRELKQVKQAGVNTIVDATTFDLGRDASLLAEVSRKSGVNLIATTGWWLEMPHILGNFSIDQFTELFIREIRVGVNGTTIKAGILKSAADIGGVTPTGEITLRAVARAHLQTKVPIMLHSYPFGQVGRSQLAILKEEGVDLKWVKVDHCTDTTDVEYLGWLLEQGCYLGMDKYPGTDVAPNFSVSPLARIKTLKALIDAGYSSRLLVSHDACLVSTLLDTAPAQVKEAVNQRNPYGFLYINKVVFPQLQEMGIAVKPLISMCTDNPRHFFEGSG